MPLPLFNNKPTHPLSKIKYILAVAAGKGGVGKSTVTVNLALALKMKGFSVGIMDTDLYGPSVRCMLPEEKPPSQNGQLIQPAVCSGIKMISMAYFKREQEATVIRAPIANGLTNQFIQKVDWGKLDFLLIDFPPGTGDIQLTLSQQANLSAALMVTTPQHVAVLDVRKAMHLFQQVQVPIVGIVENMSYYQQDEQSELIYLFGKGGGEKLARETGSPFLGQIPLDSEICSSGDRGISFFGMDPLRKKKSTQAFIQLADQVVTHLNNLTTFHSDELQNFRLEWKEMGV